jgi:hypothetical protein
MDDLSFFADVIVYFILFFFVAWNIVLYSQQEEIISIVGACVGLSCVCAYSKDN